MRFAAESASVKQGATEVCVCACARAHACNAFLLPHAFPHTKLRSLVGVQRLEAAVEVTEEVDAEPN